MIDRRELLAEILMLVGAASVSSTSIEAMTARLTMADSKGKFLLPDEMVLLRQMAEAMIPATDTPGAVQAGVPEYIDGLMVEWAGEGARAQLRRAIGEYRTLANARGKTAAAKMGAMTELDLRSFAAPPSDAGAEAYRWLKRIVFLVYRTSEAAFTTYVPNPGRYRGNLSRAEYDALVAEQSVGRA